MEVRSNIKCRGGDSLSGLLLRGAAALQLVLPISQEERIQLVPALPSQASQKRTLQAEEVKRWQAPAPMASFPMALRSLVIQPRLQTHLAGGGGEAQQGRQRLAVVLQQTSVDHNQGM